MKAHRLCMAAVALALGACAGHGHRVVGDGATTGGRLEHGVSGQPDRLQVERGGKRFDGRFEVVRQQDWERLREHFQSDPRRWERIVAGLDRSHELTSASVDLAAADGERLHCELVWPSPARPAGSCVDAGGGVFWLEFE